MRHKKIYFNRILSLMVPLAILCGILMPRGIANAAEKSAYKSTDTLSVRDVFVDIPLNVLDLLDRTTRVSMLVYWDMDSIWDAPNAMEGLSRLDTITDNYLKVKLTDISNLQIKLLPYKKGKLIMTIYNIGGDDGGDSDIRFYDTKFNELKKDKFFKPLQLKDFFDIPKGSVTTLKEISTMLPFYTTIINAGPDNDDLQARLTVGEYINQDDMNIMRLFMVPEVKFTWDGSKYKR